MKISFSFIFVLLSILAASQEYKLFQGQVLNINTKQPLPYTNVVIQNAHKGTICNEDGYFSIAVDTLTLKDTLVFSFIGYKIYKLAYNPLDTFKLIYLEEDLINLTETFVFGETPDAKVIIKKIVENKNKNYKSSCQKMRAFVRERDITKIPNFKLRMKKNSFVNFNRELLKEIENKVPKKTVSYEDFFGDLYFSDQTEEGLKIKAIKLIALSQEDVELSKPLENSLNKMFLYTKENEYWKVKSGLFSQRADINVGDSTQNEIDNSVVNSEVLSMREIDNFNFSKMKNNEDWEFLYEPNDYEYIIESGTSINGEDVYIVDFTPKKSGKFEGRLYVAMQSYALIRADFKYAEDKHGFGIKLLGVGYQKSNMRGSILFENKNGSYQVKYFAYSEVTKFSVKRPLALIKKKKRMFWDKTLEEVKLNLDITTYVENSREVFILDNEFISHQEWTDFMPEENIKIQYVNQFSDDNWKGYSIIQPTQEMRLYKKPQE